MKTVSTTALIPLVAALMSAGISPVSAGCYFAGLAFPDRSVAKWHVRRACEGYDGNRGALQGSFAPVETKSACVDIASGDKIIISATNKNTRASFDLADSECTSRLSEIINVCDNGGESDVAGWHYR
jgi:hypothetical protein